MLKRVKDWREWRSGGSGGLEGRQGTDQQIMLLRLQLHPFSGPTEHNRFPAASKKNYFAFSPHGKQGDIDCIASILYYFMPVCVTL
jgi:hypothetical protein